VVSFTPQPLYSQRKSSWYPLDRRLSGPQSRSGRDSKEKNSQPPPVIEPQNSDRPARSPALYRLSYHGSIGTQYTYTKLSLCLNKHHTMKTYWGSARLEPRILTLATRLRWVVSFTPRLLYSLGKSPRYPLDTSLSGPQSRSGRGGEEKNSLPLLPHAARSLVTILTELPRLYIISSTFTQLM
jgi:hypothetical protein